MSSTETRLEEEEENPTAQGVNLLLEAISSVAEEGAESKGAMHALAERLFAVVEVIRTEAAQRAAIAAAEVTQTQLEKMESVFHDVAKHDKERSAHLMAALKTAEEALQQRDAARSDLAAKSSEVASLQERIGQLEGAVSSALETTGAMEGVIGRLKRAEDLNEQYRGAFQIAKERIEQLEELAEARGRKAAALEAQLSAGPAAAAAAAGPPVAAEERDQYEAVILFLKDKVVAGSEALQRVQEERDEALDLLERYEVLLQALQSQQGAGEGVHRAEDDNEAVEETAAPAAPAIARPSAPSMPEPVIIPISDSEDSSEEVLEETSEETSDDPTEEEETETENSGEEEEAGALALAPHSGGRRPLRPQPEAAAQDPAQGEAAEGDAPISDAEYADLAREMRAVLDHPMAAELQGPVAVLMQLAQQLDALRQAKGELESELAAALQEQENTEKYMGQIEAHERDTEEQLALARAAAEADARRKEREKDALLASINGPTPRSARPSAYMDHEPADESDEPDAPPSTHSGALADAENTSALEEEGDEDEDEEEEAEEEDGDEDEDEEEPEDEAALQYENAVLRDALLKSKRAHDQMRSMVIGQVDALRQELQGVRDGYEEQLGEYRGRVSELEGQLEAAVDTALQAKEESFIAEERAVAATVVGGAALQGETAATVGVSDGEEGVGVRALLQWKGSAEQAIRVMERSLHESQDMNEQLLEQTSQLLRDRETLAALVESLRRKGPATAESDESGAAAAAHAKVQVLEAELAEMQQRYLQSLLRQKQLQDTLQEVAEQKEHEATLESMRRLGAAAIVTASAQLKKDREAAAAAAPKAGPAKPATPVKKSPVKAAALHTPSPSKTRGSGLTPARPAAPQPIAGSGGAAAAASRGSVPVPPEILEMMRSFDGDEGLGRPLSAAPGDLRKRKEPPVPDHVIQKVREYDGDEGYGRPTSATPSAYRPPRESPVPVHIQDLSSLYAGGEGAGRPRSAAPSALRPGSGLIPPPSMGLHTSVEGQAVELGGLSGRRSFAPADDEVWIDSENEASEEESDQDEAPAAAARPRTAHHTDLRPSTTAAAAQRKRRPLRPKTAPPARPSRREFESADILPSKKARKSASASRSRKGTLPPPPRPAFGAGPGITMKKTKTRATVGSGGNVKLSTEFLIPAAGGSPAGPVRKQKKSKKSKAAQLVKQLVTKADVDRSKQVVVPKKTSRKLSAATAHGGSAVAGGSMARPRTRTFVGALVF